MKKLLPLLFAATLSSFGASIADFCNPVVTWAGSTNTATNGPAVCPSFSALVASNPNNANFVLDSVELFWTIGVTPQNLAGAGAAPFNITMTIDNPTGPGAPSFPELAGLILSQVFSGSSAQSASSSVLTTSIGNGTSTWSPVTNIVVTQGYGSASFDFSVRYNYTDNTPPPPQGDIPEPSSMALMGAGLVAVAAYARRKK